MPGILASFESFPSANISEAEFLRRDRDEFETFRSLGLLRKVDAPTGSFLLARDNGAYIAKRYGDRYVGIEADEIEPEVTEIDASEVRRWELNVSALVRHLSRENDFRGQVEQITERLWYVGECNGSQVLLGLYGNENMLESEALSLAQRLPIQARSITLVCPSMSPKPSVARRLEDNGVSIGHLSEDDPFHIEIAQARKEVHDPGEVVFSDDYRTISLRGTPFTLSMKQAAAVRILHRAHRVGLPGASWDSIRNQLKAIDYYPERMQDVFKGVKDWRKLIKLIRPGFYSLNL